MGQFWSKDGADPEPLPFQDTLPDGTMLTDLSGHPESCEALGWVAVPDPPAYDPIRQRPAWAGGAWTVVSTIPQQVSRMQAFYVLKTTPSPSGTEGRSWFQDFDEAIRASGNIKLINYWDTAADFHRDHPDLIAFATSMGVSSDQVDTLFVAADAVT